MIASASLENPVAKPLNANRPRKGAWNTVCSRVQAVAFALGVAVASRGESMGHMLRALARSPFVTGLARSVDLLGALNQPMPYDARNSPQQDQRAIADDWRAVGRDIGAAVDQVLQPGSHTAA
jgi:hypothetical protein